MPKSASNVEKPTRRLTGRLVAAFAFALALAFSVYLLLGAFRPGGPWIASLWFLALLPALLSAIICYFGDPDRTRSAGFYWAVPPVLVGMVVFGSAWVLHEGVICLIMLSPIWLLCGWAGAFLLRSRRRRNDYDRVFESSFLIIPLLAGVVEAQIPQPHEQVQLSRSIVVQARPEEIWPYAVSNPSISPDEGRWTITHNVIGLARPRATVLDGRGVGAVRTAYWGDRINFQELITEWKPGEKLGWRFRFSNSSLQDYSDKHISPDGPLLTIESGDYVIRRLSADRSELTLSTRYVAKTHVNFYAKLWGVLLLGDTEDNILSIIKARSEAAHLQAAST